MPVTGGNWKKQQAGTGKRLWPNQLGNLISDSILLSNQWKDLYAEELNHLHLCNLKESIC